MDRAGERCSGRVPLHRGQQNILHNANWWCYAYRNNSRNYSFLFTVQHLLVPQRRGLLFQWCVPPKPKLTICDDWGINRDSQAKDHRDPRHQLPRRSCCDVHRRLSFIPSFYSDLKVLLPFQSEQRCGDCRVRHNKLRGQHHEPSGQEFHPGYDKWVLPGQHPGLFDKQAKAVIQGERWVRDSSESIWNWRPLKTTKACQFGNWSGQEKGPVRGHWILRRHLLQRQ